MDETAPTQLFVITRNNNLVLLRQEEEASSYQTVQKISLLHIKELTAKINELASKPFPVLSISELCMTAGGKTYIFETGHSESLSCKESGDMWSISHLETNASNSLSINLAFKIGKKLARIIIKPDPSSRKICLLDTKSQREVLTVCFISNEHILLKMLHSQTKYINDQGGNSVEDVYESDDQSYWTMMNANTCEIIKMPSDLERVLTSDNWTQLKTQATGNSRTQVLLQSDIQVAELTFNLQGQLLTSTKFPFFLLEHPLWVDKNYFLPQISSETVFSTRGELYLVADGLHKDKKGHDGEISVCISPGLSGTKTLNTLIFLRSKQYLGDYEDKKSNIYNEGTLYAGCGNYLCYKEKDKPEIFVIDLNELLRGVQTPAKRVIELSKIVEQTLIENPTITFEPCPWFYQLYRLTGSLREIEDKRSQMSILQVTVGDRAVVFNLAADNKETISAISELSKVKDFMDPETYVESNITMTQASKSSTQLGAGQFSTYLLKQQIIPNFQGSMFLKRQTIQSRKHQAMILSKQEDARPFLGLYRSFNEIDLIEIKRLNKLIEAKKNIANVGLSHLCTVIRGQTIFSLLAENLGMLKQVTKQLQEIKFEGEEDAENIENELQIMRRMKLILSYTTLFSKTEDQSASDLESTSELSCVLQRSLLSDKIQTRDQLLHMTNMFINFVIFGVMPNLESCQKLFESSTPTVVECLGRCFMETQNTQYIKQINWPKEESSISFRHKNLMISEDECQAEINRKVQAKEEDKIKTAVLVRVHELSWIYEGGKDFPDLVKIIISSKSNPVFDSEFVKLLVTEFWDKNFKKLLIKMFIPFVGHVVLVFAHLLVALKPEDDETNKLHWPVVLTGVLASVSWIWEVIQEIRQQIQNGYNQYFRSFYTWSDLVHLSLTLVSIIANFPTDKLISNEIQRILASLITCALMIKMFDQLRLFERTSFYILLIEETIYDIYPFLFLFFVSLIMFGFPLMFLNYNRDEDSEIVGQVSGEPIIDAVLGQYSSVLSGFDSENYANGGDKFFCILFFILATLFTQILMLNMIIAFMGDTFERIAENKDVYAAKGKLELLSEYAFLLKDSSNAEKEKIFLFVVKPIGEEENDLSTWQGSIHRMQQLTKKQIFSAETKIIKKVSVLNENLNEKISNLKESNQNLKEKLDQTITSLKDDNKSLKDDNKQLKEDMKEILAFLKNLVPMTSENRNRA